MQFKSAAIFVVATVLGVEAVVVPKASEAYRVKINQSGVQNDAKVSKYIGKDGLYAVYQPDASLTEKNHVAFAKGKKSAETFSREVVGNVNILKGSKHGYLGTTQAPQGFGGVFFQDKKDTKVQLTYSPGPSNNIHLTCKENLFNNWMFCYHPDGNNLHWTKLGLNLEQFNKNLPEGHHCAYVNLDVEKCQ